MPQNTTSIEMIMPEWLASPSVKTAETARPVEDRTFFEGWKRHNCLFGELMHVYQHKRRWNDSEKKAGTCKPRGRHMLSLMADEGRFTEQLWFRQTAAGEQVWAGRWVSPLIFKIHKHRQKLALPWSVGHTPDMSDPLCHPRGNHGSVGD